MVLSILVLLVASIFILGHFGLPEPARPMPEPIDPRQIMPGAEPYRFEGTSGVAFLICHGFEDSPLTTRPLGEFLHGLGHTSIGILLPGHGTKIEDLTRVRFYHWQDYLETLFREERSKYRKVFLVGFSMGGTLMLDLAGRFADTYRPAGVLTISSPVFFNGFFNGKLIIHQPMTMFTGIMRIFTSILRIEGKKKTNSMQRLNPWLGYDATYALDTLHSFKRSLSGVRRVLPRISVPYCSIMAANDRTVSAENQIYIYNNIGSREKRALQFILPPDMTNMHTLLTHKKAQKRVLRFIQEFVDDTLKDFVPETPRRGFFARLFRRTEQSVEN
ncbi:MAG TPA: alpha/beta fold hydrolase [Leptospiraceae bacterium]|nr:alpha/beta fold hydrolase [Leptospirales bacterium]HMW61053.1 alpha/beta fold hydrolase [Leptospiraceae bacterium]HMX55396.1 alpha/beta fold hydrolase [Leptospiraceae bacterium]HMY46554.1 alpha/beta fold hydrolase [Leptospiraceae bacterium]HMZ36888.1 alpha/beta fold hydrolase [Leptospiraceae bacterium]